MQSFSPLRSWSFGSFSHKTFATVSAMPSVVVWHRSMKWWRGHFILSEIKVPISVMKDSYFSDWTLHISYVGALFQWPNSSAVWWALISVTKVPYIGFEEGYERPLCQGPTSPYLSRRVHTPAIKVFLCQCWRRPRRLGKEVRHFRITLFYIKIPKF